jgi:AraC family transcriptional regulator
VAITPPQNQLSFHSLYDSPLVRVHDYQCHACQSGPTGEEQAELNTIVLMRNGAFRQHFGTRSVTATVNQAVFFSKDSSYRVSHPTECGDRGTVLFAPERVLNDIIRELDPTIDEHPERPFPFVTGPCDSNLFWQHRELVRRLEVANENPLEPLWADVTALQLIADVLAAAFARHALPRQRKRSGTDADHADRVEAVKAYLATHFSERLTLDEISRAVAVSPFHLARIFQQHAGVPVHRYLTQLRLRAALEQLAAGAQDLTALALELGFSSHSHFTDAFRREFGRTPSAARNANPRGHRELNTSSTKFC